MGGYALICQAAWIFMGPRVRGWPWGRLRYA